MTARFEAYFAGNPKPEVTWLREGEPMQNTKKVQIRVKEHKTTLTLIDCTEEDQGYYSVRISNELGTDTSRASLTISSTLKLHLKAK